MIKLYGFGPKFGLIDPSPFVAKIHAFCKMANIEYETIENPRNLDKAPKRKLPFIVDGDKTVCDSQAIVEYLYDNYAPDFDSHLSKQDKASSYLISKSLDENLYWCLVWGRWKHPATWKVVKKAFFGGLPFPLSAFVPNMLRKRVIKALHGQGMGRHSDEEIIAIADHSFSALSDLLGDKPYFFGDKVCSFDATAFAFIDACTQSTLETDIYDKAKSYKNLVAYAQRIKQEYFS